MTPIRTWIDGYLAIREHALRVRGSIALDSGAGWPRTTGADVIAIIALFDTAVATHGTYGIVHRWAAVREDARLEALSAPSDTYVENRSFWSVLETVAVFLDDGSISPPPPRLWEALVAQIGSAHRNVGPVGDGPFGHFDGVKTYDDLYLAQYKHLRELRGSDTVKAPTGSTGFEKPIPRSTNSDVVQLAAYWSDRLASVKHVMGYEGVAARWKPIAHDVEIIAKSGKPDAVYPKNNEFWRALADLVLTVAVADEAPTTWDVVTDSVKYGLSHLPETLEHAASAGADLVASAASAAGRVANEAGRGLFRGFGTPLLIGAGVLGAFLISRHHHHAED